MEICASGDLCVLTEGSRGRICTQLRHCASTPLSDPSCISASVGTDRQHASNFCQLKVNIPPSASIPVRRPPKPHESCTWTVPSSAMPVTNAKCSTESGPALNPTLHVTIVMPFCSSCLSPISALIVDTVSRAPQFVCAHATQINIKCKAEVTSASVNSS